MLGLLLLPLLACQALAAPAQGPQIASFGSPTVTIKNGTVVGSSKFGVDSFIGIPFAKPPVGDLRLRAPQSITSSFGTFKATGIAPACPQFYFATEEFPEAALGVLLNLPFVQTVLNEKEDCLTLDVRKPVTAKAGSKLPVLLYIFGGGFELGSTQLYDGTNIIQKSMILGKDIVYVAINYRVGGFGFLGGKEVMNDGASNLGLKDQRLALQWVAENIAAFGGDPDKVTIWGESAGAISVFDHTIINGGDHTYQGKPLFRATIMDSGSVTPSQSIDSVKAQSVYDRVVEEAGCAGTPDSLQCLREADYSTLLDATNSVPGVLGYRSVDLSYFPRPDPSDNFFPVSPDDAVPYAAKVPVIIGDQEDEGTLFALFQNNLTTSDDITDYLATIFTETNRETCQGLVETYSENPADGSPFRTGIFNQLYPQYKRLAALIGDTVFTLVRRAYLEDLNKRGIPTWSYLSTYLYGTPIIGTVHASDVLALFFNLNVPALPPSSILTHYISFVNDLDPNRIKTPATLLNWPRWEPRSRMLMQFNALTNSYLKDDFREESKVYLKDHQKQLRV